MLLQEMFGRGRAAPEINPADTVETPMGRGVVIDARQNRDGHYVMFTVEITHGPHTDEISDFGIHELRPLPASKATNYLDHAPDRAGGNIDTEAT
jgi:hypothetical protein